MREISVASAESDDNGAYISKGNARRFFQYNADGTRTVHKENGIFYANVKTAKGYRRDYVPENEDFELTRFYRASKWNPTFTRTIATVKGVQEKELRPFYLVMSLYIMYPIYIRVTGAETILGTVDQVLFFYEIY